MKLNDLKIGDEHIIKVIAADENIKKRLLDIGFVNGGTIKPLIKNKSMTVYKIKGTVIGIRNDDTKNIEVSS